MLVLLALLVTSGCADIAYYAQSARGQWEVIRAAEPIADVLLREDISAEVREKLETVQRVRTFARTELRMSFNDSYTRYVALDRDYLLKNLVAAPEFSTQLHHWCYPIIGCASYRGYFDLEQLAKLDKAMQEKGYDTYAYPVNAYSTLGWFTDPVMESFLDLSLPQLIELILHELAHQQLYIQDDTVFNESFATAVAQAGARQFPGMDATNDDGDADIVREEIYAIAAQARQTLDALYASPLQVEEKRRQKALVFEQLQNSFLELATAFPKHRSLRSLYEEPLNNARLGIMLAYTAQVPAFLRLLDINGGDFTAFFAHSERLGALSQQDRQTCMAALLQGSQSSVSLPEDCR